MTEDVTEVTVTEYVTEEVTEEVTEDVTEEMTEDVTKHVTEEVREDVTEEVLEDVMEEVTENPPVIGQVEGRNESANDINIVSEIDHSNAQNFSSNETNIDLEQTVDIGNPGSTDSVNVKHEVVSALSDIFSGQLLTDEVDYFVDSILERIKAKSENRSQTKTELEGQWVTSDTHLVCQPCLKHGKSDNLPSKLKSHYKKGFGIIAKGTNFQEKYSRSRHESSELHIWCAQEYKRIDALNKETEEKSVKAGMLVVRNALLCLKRGLSAKDFVYLND